MKLLITGGAGFVGSNFIHYVLRKYSDWEIVNLDKLTYAGNLENLRDKESDPRYRFVKGNIADQNLVNELLSEGFDLIVNFAAETHVDRSFIDPAPFVETNVKGTQVLLEGARRHPVKRFIHLSTPEVYGGSSPLQSGQYFTEGSPFLPNNPYSASKAAADMICRAYHRTYGLPVMSTRFANAFGPYQHPEKLFPLSVTRALKDEPIPVYGEGQYRRNWIYITDICKAIDLIIHGGKAGEAYNISSGHEMSNLELVHKILDILHKPHQLITFVPDRPSHDWQYPLDSAKIKKEFGWKLTSDFEKTVVDTIEWYKQNRDWWEKLQVLDYGKWHQEISKSKEGFSK